MIHQFMRLSSFAEQLLVHEHAVVKISPDMPLDRAALIGCGVTTGVGAVFRTARVEPGATVAVIGCGGIGLNVVQGARIAGAGRIIAVDVNRDKLERAEEFGATDVVDAAQGDAVAAVRDMIARGKTLCLATSSGNTGSALAACSVTWRVRSASLSARVLSCFLTRSASYSATEAQATIPTWWWLPMRCA